jgi:hypothetical protein
MIMTLPWSRTTSLRRCSLLVSKIAGYQGPQVLKEIRKRRCHRIVWVRLQPSMSGGICPPVGPFRTRPPETRSLILAWTTHSLVVPRAMLAIDLDPAPAA